MGPSREKRTDDRQSSPLSSPKRCPFRKAPSGAAPCGCPAEAVPARAISACGLSRHQDESILACSTQQAEGEGRQGAGRGATAHSGTGGGPSPPPRAPSPIAAPLCDRCPVPKMTTSSTTMAPCFALHPTRRRSSATMTTIYRGSTRTAPMMPCSPPPLRTPTPLPRSMTTEVTSPATTEVAGRAGAMC